jgi:hypothetical protein
MGAVEIYYSTIKVGYEEHDEDRIDPTRKSTESQEQD